MKRFFLNNKADIASILLLLGLTLLFFWRVPLQGKVLLPLDVLHSYEPWRSEVPGALGIKIWNSWLTDPVRQFYPVLTVIQATWQQGHIPFWNPYALTGMPIIAAGLHQAFYPVTVFLLLVMPVAQAMSWSIILHTFLGAFFCYLFLGELNVIYYAALIGAITFVFNGSIVILMTSLGRFPTIMWLPLLFWALEFALRRRQWRWFVLGGLVLCMQLLAGHLQMVLYSLTALGFYAGYRAFLDWLPEKKGQQSLLPLIFFITTLAVGLGLAAFQLLPILELTPHGVRSAVGVDQADVSLDSVKPEISPKIILRLFVPDILGTDLDHNIAPGFSHEFYIYFGLLSLLFIIAALFSLQQYLAWGLVSFGLLIGLVIYEVPPFYQLFQIFYPSFEQLGFHRAQIIIVFFWAVAAALGFDWLIKQRPQIFLTHLIRVGWFVTIISGLLILMVAFAGKYQARHFWPQLLLPETSLDPLYLLSSLLFSLVIFSSSISLLWAWQRAKISRFVFGSLALIILVFDIFLAHIDFNAAYDPDMLFPKTPSLTHLLDIAVQEQEPFRIMSVNRLFWGDMATVFNLSDIQGYDSFLMQRYSDYLDLTNARAEANFRIAAFAAKTSKFLDALNVKYYYAPRYMLVAGEWISLLAQVDKPLVQSDQAYAGTIADWTIDGWPQQVLLAPTPSRITYRGFLSYPTQIETAIAIAPEAWTQPGAEVLFEVYARRAPEGSDELVFSQRLTQIDQPENLAWLPVVIDLSEFTGQEVLVSFVTSTAKPAVKWDAAWADPLLMDSSKVELLHYGPNSIYLNKHYLPRAWVVHQVTDVAEGDLDAVRAVMSKPTFDPAVEAVVEGSLTAPLSARVSDEPVKFVDYSANYSKIEANIASSGLLVFSDIFYPGWNAYIDGRQQPLYATNLMMRGVVVPAGEHQIEFIYQPRSFWTGVYISLVTASLLILALIFGRNFKMGNIRWTRE